MTKIQVDSNGKAIMLNNKALEANEGSSTLITKIITENGTYNASSDNADGYSSVTINVSGGGSTHGKYLVRVIDYEGTVLKSERLDTGDTFTLPSQPSHMGLVFQSWSSPVAITNNTVTVTNSDITIGATYTTASGLSEFDITLTTATGLSVTLNMDGTKDWGDGTSDTSTTHTYASAGDYTITCNGSTMTTSRESGGLFGQNSYTMNYYVKDVRFGSSVTSIGDYALYNCCSLISITLPNTVVTIGVSVFIDCFSLTSITIPEGVTTTGSYHCASLVSIAIPSSVTSIGAFGECSALTNITIPEGVTTIEDNTFYYCTSLTSMTMPSSITSIGYESLQLCYSILEYDFSRHTSVPILVDEYSIDGINKLCKIKVPASLEAEWKTATNWSAYADYIIGV